MEIVNYEDVTAQLFMVQPLNGRRHLKLYEWTSRIDKPRIESSQVLPLSIDETLIHPPRKCFWHAGTRRIFKDRAV